MAKLCSCNVGFPLVFCGFCLEVMTEGIALYCFVRALRSEEALAETTGFRVLCMLVLALQSSVCCECLQDTSLLKLIYAVYPSFFCDSGFEILPAGRYFRVPAVR